MKRVTVASGDYIVYHHPFTIVSNVFMRNGTYPLMFIGRVYNIYLTPLPQAEYNTRSSFKSRVLLVYIQYFYLLDWWSYCNILT